ncbi:MAG: hypothetical protein ACI4AH_04280 [Muribaculaceae bacterium]
MSTKLLIIVVWAIGCRSSIAKNFLLNGSAPFVAIVSREKWFAANVVGIAQKNGAYFGKNSRQLFGRFSKIEISKG